jgi:hypothetical protein
MSIRSYLRLALVFAVCIKVHSSKSSTPLLDIKTWDPGKTSWTQSSTIKQPNVLSYVLNDIKPNADYTVSINNKPLKQVKSNTDGTL